MSETKTCTRCKKTKPLEEYQIKLKGRTSQCKVCLSKSLKRKRLTPEGHLAFFKSRILSKFGVTWNQYQEMFKKQNGCCAICGIHQSKLTKRLHVDHDHKTDRIRGLLCRHCNLFLGNIKDSKEFLSNALKYLDETIVDR
jgi:hypothetical protein